MSDLALKVEGLTKSFQMGGNTLPVLRGVDLDVHVGERIAIVGTVCIRRRKKMLSADMGQSTWRMHFYGRTNSRYCD